MIFHDFLKVFKQVGCSSSGTTTTTSGDNVNDSGHHVAKHADDSWQRRWWLLMAVAGKPAAWMCNWGRVLDMEGYHFMVHTNDNLPPTTVYTYIIIAVMAVAYFNSNETIPL